MIVLKSSSLAGIFGLFLLIAPARMMAAAPPPSAKPDTSSIPKVGAPPTDDKSTQQSRLLVEDKVEKIPVAGGVLARLNFSPDGKWLMICDYRSVQFWDLTGADPQKVSSFNEQDLHVRDILAAAISPDGTLVALGGYDKGVHLYNLKDMQLVEMSNEKEHDGAVRALQFSPDGKTLLSGGEDVAVFVWDINENGLRKRTMFKIENSIFGVQALGFTSDGKSFYVSTGAGDVRKVELGAGEPRETLAFKEPATLALPMAVTLDGKKLAFGSRKNVVLRQAGKDAKPFEKHTAQVNAMAFNGDGTLLASVAEDGRLIIWDLAGNVRYSTQRPNPFSAVAFRPPEPGATDFSIAAANKNGTVYLIHLKPEK